MESALAAVPWGAVTPWGVIMFAVTLVLTGRLVPKKSVDEIRADRDYWRKAAIERSKQMQVLLPSLDVQTKMIQAVVQSQEPGGAEDTGEEM